MLLHNDIVSRWAADLVQEHDVPAALVVIVVVVSLVAEREAAAPPGAAELLGVVQHHAVGGEQNAAPLPCLVERSCPTSRHARGSVMSGRQ